ncbi:MAG: ribose 5-phosphate isomerase A [Candidatus Bathyarchaeia archaeon]
MKKCWKGWDKWKLRPENLVEEAKRKAAREAVRQIEDGQVIGLGSGSTVAYAAEELGERIKTEKIRVKVVPTSYQALMLAINNGIPVTSLDENPRLSLAIDGVDQIDCHLNMIKGMGGALTREKIVASASERLLIVADWRKRVKTLGENNHPVPIEVLPFALKPVTLKIIELGGKPIIREGGGKVGPVVTDNGNFIIDAYFGLISDPESLERKLKSIPGVIETGLFIDMAETVYIGEADGVKVLRRKN